MSVLGRHETAVVPAVRREDGRNSTNSRHEVFPQLLRLTKKLTRIHDGDTMAAWLVADTWRHEQIEHIHQQVWKHSDEGRRQISDLSPRYSTGIDWNEFRTSTPWNGTS